MKCWAIKVVFYLGGRPVRHCSPRYVVFPQYMGKLTVKEHKSCVEKIYSPESIDSIGWRQFVVKVDIEIPKRKKRPVAVLPVNAKRRELMVKESE